MFLADEISSIDWENLNPVLLGAMIAVAVLIVIVSIISGVVSIWLAIRYIRYNRKQNSIGMTGRDAARKLLDENGLSNIKVSCTGSILFGNSYSAYFHKVRLRRLTHKKKSISSLAMAAQKTSLAVLHKEKDPDMMKRIVVLPIINFGPLLCVPLIVIGAIIDIIVLNGSGVATIVATVLGLGLYALAFVLSILELKTEKKAQKRALKELKDKNMANSEELGMMKDLFHLYNIEYVNNMILALLELIWRVLQIVAQIQSNSSSSKN